MNYPRTCKIGSVEIGSGQLALIAGPCMAESRALCLDVAGAMTELCNELGIGYIFKASYDKANRSSVESYRGPGAEAGLAWLAEVKETFGIPVLSDVHDTSQVQRAAEVLDVLQIPAFLCRQSDLLVAAGETGKAVHIKKGQFMAPWDMKQAVEKVLSTGNRQVLLCDRGTSFGYNRLISDMRAMPIMRAFAPVVFDATHSTQEPGGLGGSASGGERQFAPVLAAAATAAGADALFIETHTDPDHAKSDAACQLLLDDMEPLLKKCLALFHATRATY